MKLIPSDRGYPNSPDFEVETDLHVPTDLELIWCYAQSADCLDLENIFDSNSNEEEDLGPLDDGWDIARAVAPRRCAAFREKNPDFRIGWCSIRSTAAFGDGEELIFWPVMIDGNSVIMGYFEYFYMSPQDDGTGLSALDEAGAMRVGELLVGSGELKPSFIESFGMEWGQSSGAPGPDAPRDVGSPPPEPIHYPPPGPFCMFADNGVRFSLMIGLCLPSLVSCQELFTQRSAGGSWWQGYEPIVWDVEKRQG